MTGNSSDFSLKLKDLLSSQLGPKTQEQQEIRSHNEITREETTISS